MSFGGNSLHQIISNTLQNLKHFTKVLLYRFISVHAVIPNKAFLTDLANILTVSFNIPQTRF